MAFRELVEGDCGGPSSLMRLASHYVQDHGFKEEGIQPFRPSETFQTQDADQLVQQFLEEPACPQTFRMDNLLQEMRDIDQNIHPPIAAPGVVKELSDLDTAWENLCFKSAKQFEEHHVDNIWNTPLMQSTQEENTQFLETSKLGLDSKWVEDYLEHNINSVQDNINKNNAQIIKDEDPNYAYSRFMKFMKQEGDIPIEAQREIANLDDGIEELEQYFVHKQKPEDSSIDNINYDGTVLNKVEEELEAAGTWIDEFEKENPSSDSLWKRFQDEWDKVSADELSSTHPWVSEFDTYYDPFNKEYEFCETNPMKDLPNALAEGKKRLEAGDLPSAVLCFEAAVQQDENNVEAWLLLGKTQAENEQDPLAISALNRCLCLEPSNSVALMALAASYANESYQKQACLTLKEWLLKNQKYKHLSIPESNLTKDKQQNFSVSTLLYDKVYDEVKDLYIQAARMNPRDEIDADVQCGLGILFNLSSDYNKAVDCFQAALQVRPDDSRLWNRLGATLANGQRSAEAVNAYHRALELSPGFIRARYNLGISCVNLGVYKEAGEHLLTALNQQAAGRGPQANTVSPKAMSNTIWSTLRLVISLMHKYELMEAVENRDLSKLNKEFEII
ncbi:peroxisomal targeting signal 1 receptor isoform X2 [Camponotus floridanus]|uniref:peroxisomal targeting signal 1 receptor isoform X2 n=1 Tax=Camponotus floridanus TaxID=104421 RepID=UPI00059DCB01|nr:peroxisomal targeting signal 1 receptor isoform X2 [Camponotus floridanus]